MAILEDLFGTLFSGFSTGNVIGIVNILLLVLIIGGGIFLFVWTFWKMLKYNSLVVILAKTAQGNVVEGFDRYGIFKDKDGLVYAKLRKRRIKINLPDYEGLIREGKRVLLILVKAGEGTYYQVLVPKKFYTVDGKLALPVIDHNALKQAGIELVNMQRKLRKADSIMEKYGVHIAILVVVFVLIIGGYILLRKEEQLIQLITQALNVAQGLREDAIGQAIAT